MIIEADQIDIEVFFLKGRQLQPQQFLIPAGVERELVVGDDACLRIRQNWIVETKGLDA